MHSASIIQGLLPPMVRSADTYGDDLNVRLWPSEAHLAQDMSPARAAEFATVRVLARAALQALGRTPTAILPGPGGAPRWPSRVVGSMTHCDGYRAAAVAHSDAVLSLGIDAEPDLALPDGLLDLVASDDELASFGTIEGQGVAADRLLFSAKEAAFKAWFPRTGRWLEFTDMALILGADGTFSAQLRDESDPHSHLLTGLQGRWASVSGILLTTGVIRIGTARDLTADRWVTL